MGMDEDKKSLLKEIEELENEIKGMKTRIPLHSVRYEMIQLLEEKEVELKRRKDLLQSMRE
jgi:hypothetical protein